MVCVAKGANHGPRAHPRRGKMDRIEADRRHLRLYARRGLVRAAAGRCKLSLNVKGGVIQEALVETIGCSGHDPLGGDGRRRYSPGKDDP